MKPSYKLRLNLILHRTPKVNPKFRVILNNNIIYDSVNMDLIEDNITLDFLANLGNNDLWIELYDKNDADMVIVDGKIIHNIAVQLQEIILDGVNLSQYNVLENFGSHGFIGHNSIQKMNFLAPGFLFVRNANLLK